MKSSSLIELYVETLTGSVFEIKVSPFSNILELKSKIQQLEGIPASQQHIVWNSTELKDEKSLEDYQISDGATLHLVLGMKGGPISLRSAQAEEMMLKEMSEYVEANKDSLMDSVASDSLVTLYVYRDGESINVVKVVERSDGSSSPLSSSSSKQTDGLTESIKVRRKNENIATKEKMTRIRSKMALMSNAEKKVNKKEASVKKTKSHKRPSSIPQSSHVQLPPLRGQPSAKGAPSVVASSIRKKVSKSTSRSRTGHVNPKGASKPSQTTIGHQKSQSNSSEKLYKEGNSQTMATFSNPSQLTTGSKMKELRQRLKSDHDTSTNSNKGRLSTGINNDPVRSALRSSWAEPSSNLPSNASNPLLDSLNRLNLHDRVPEHLGISRYLHSSLNSKLPLPQIKPRNSNENSDKTGPDSNDYKLLISPRKCLNAFEKEAEDDLTRNGAAARAFMLSILNQNFPQYQSENTSSSISEKASGPSNQVNSIPSGSVRQTVEKPSKLRCALCRKKTGLVTSYLCRCGENFCSSHRYAEAHNCSFDYKDEGRRLLEKNNPLVTAPKVPKI